MVARRPRKAKRSSAAFLNRHQIKAAHKLYTELGLSVPQLAERLWKKWRFKSPATCEHSLYTAFRLEGYARRTAAGTVKQFGDAATCAVCGCPVDEFTKGCRRCASRHRWRRANGRPYLLAPARRGCAGCGGGLDERTHGCENCRMRAYRRRVRAAA